VKIDGGPQKCPKPQISWAIPFENELKVSKTKVIKIVAAPLTARNTKFQGLYHLKTFEKSEKLNVVRSTAGPQNAPNHKISWATTFENV
jgi:hypothetical protein